MLLRELLSHIIQCYILLEKIRWVKLFLLHTVSHAQCAEKAHRQETASRGSHARYYPTPSKWHRNLLLFHLLHPFRCSLSCSYRHPSGEARNGGEYGMEKMWFGQMEGPCSFIRQSEATSVTVAAYRWARWIQRSIVFKSHIQRRFFRRECAHVFLLKKTLGAS